MFFIKWITLFLKISIIFFLFFLLSFGIWKARQVFFDNSKWFPKEHLQEQNRSYLKQEFENGELIVFVAKLKQSFFTPTIIEQVEKVTTQIEELEFVNEVKTPLNATVALSTQDNLYVITFQSALNQNLIPDLLAYEQKLKDSFFYKRLISEDLEKIAFVVKIQIEKKPSDFFRRKAIINQVSQLLAEQPDLKDIAIAGEGELNYKLDFESRENLKLLLPLSFGVMLLLLLLVFRSFISLFIVAVTAAICLIISFLVFVYQGHPLTVVGLALPVLILVISTADSIHILSRWNSIRKNDKITSNTAFLLTFKQTWLPCLGTSVTTAIGFGSFYFSNLLPLRNFGLDSFLTIFLSYLIIIFVTFFLLFVFRNRLKPRQNNKFNNLILKFTENCFSFSQRSKKKIVIIVLVTLALLLFNLKNIFVETNFLDVFFQKKSQIYQDFLFVDKYLSGTGSVDLIFKSEDGDDFKTIEKFQAVGNLISKLKVIDNVNVVQSYLEPISMIHNELKQQASNFPTTAEQLEQELLFLEFSRGDQRTDVISQHILFDYTEGRIKLQTPNLNSSNINDLRQSIIQELLAVKGINFIITGSSIFFHSLSEEVLNTQVLSICITLIVTWLVFLFLFGCKLGSLAIIPSIFPILLTSCFIILFKVPFDFAVILIGSISFGLCVDDTIHLLHHFNRSEGEIEFRLKESVKLLSHPLAFTTILFCIGFGVFLTSDLIILIKFGFFTFITILLAFFSTIIIMPALISVFYAKQKDKN